MGSYCEIRFDSLNVCVAKSVVPDEFCVLFVESDRRVQHAPGGKPEDAPEITYEANRSVILDRLALLGCTPATTRAHFEAWLNAQLEMWAQVEPQESVPQLASALKALTFEEWQSRVPEVLQDRFSWREPNDEIERQMMDVMNEDESWLWFAGYGSLVSIHALLEACPLVQNVTLDLTDLVGGGWLEQNTAICADRRALEPLEPRPLAPTVVLAEGVSDIKILQRSLAALFPERLDYFSFFDHAELSVDGGASYLVKFLKAFAAARAPLRLIAIFDNDLAGARACEQARRLNLPSSMIILRLPDIHLARAYPTVGPQGKHVSDVNGLAASIELYLGRSVLMEGGALRPVRWTGYLPAADAYQGEIDGKANVQAAFMAELQNYSTAEAARAAHPELVSVWQEIFSAVQRSAAAAQRKMILYGEGSS